MILFKESVWLIWRKLYAHRVSFPSKRKLNYLTAYDILEKRNNMGFMISGGVNEAFMETRTRSDSL